MHRLKNKEKIIKKLGLVLNFNETKKEKNFVNTNFYLSEDYKKLLIEKQKLKYSYYLTERQIKNYLILVKKNKKIKLSLIELLNSRLDSILYISGFLKTINAARQVINHKHILVNNILTNKSSKLCSPKQYFSVRKNSNLYQKFDTFLVQKKLQESEFFIFDLKNKILILKSYISKKYPVVSIDETKIIEFYNKK